MARTNGPVLYGLICLNPSSDTQGEGLLRFQVDSSQWLGWKLLFESVEKEKYI
jgi:hypothetical protein